MHTCTQDKIKLFCFIVTTDRLIVARNFNDSFFCVGEPNLILVPSGKIISFINFCNLKWHAE